MPTILKSLRVQSLVVFVLVFGLTAAFTQPASALHQQGWKFFKTTANVENRTRDYNQAVANAVGDYNRSTDLTVYKVASGSPAQIIYIQGNYGQTGWDGGSQPLSQSVKCFSWPDLKPTGYCNKTDRKVDFAYLYINDYYGAYEQPEYGMRHEMGHVWGISHESCGNYSGIMEQGQCRPNVVETLSDHDRFELRLMYP